ncbi:S26 family signal peptidase [Rhodanobacter thiooxydans]|jgi:conjugative transfer signal peptidase TraF|uniref:S26 family signal peptidase n=1 Tax=Rhodanobacter thiooxydans TaxID=416169 RepID=UPI000260C4B8|nr:S26 family signal peptidase [Rhodanobacter thiooxydans]EIM01176.1 putative conjugal transfer TRAF transmembrane protein [Rhodanobacter thiooxydans LCS2]
MTVIPTIDTAPRPRSRRRTRLIVATLAAASLAALAWAYFVSPLPRLVYNPSDSVAVGWYRVDPLARHAGSLSPAMHVGSIVLVPLPAAVAALAARRGYLPSRIPLLKPVAAVARQQVCIAEGSVRIDGVSVAAALRIDGRGRPLHTWSACRRLRPGELFLLSTTNPASFDSRYFGPVRADAVLGVAHPLWLETRP